MRAIIGSILILLAVEMCGQSVWEYEGGPCGGTFNSIIDHKDGLAAAPNARAFVLFGDAEGTAWRQADLPDAAAVPFCLYSDGRRLYAGSFGRVYFSDDDGASWQVSQLHDLLSAPITRLTGSGDTLYGCGQGSLVRSVDRGVQWELLSEFTCNDVLMSAAGHVAVAEEARIMESSDGGANWFDRGGTPEYVEYFYSHLGVLHAARPVSALRPDVPVLFRLVDPVSGTWEACAPKEPSIRTMTEHDGVLYAGSNTVQGPHLIQSTDGGMEWEVINDTRTPFPRPRAVMVLHGAKNGLLASISNLGIWRLADNAESWRYVTDGFFPVGVARVGFLGERPVVYSMKENFVATRAGAQGRWELIPYSELMYPGDMLVMGGAVYLGIETGVRWTTDLGISWEFGTIGDGSRWVQALGDAGSRIIAGVVGGVSAWSDDRGVNWISDTSETIDKWYTFAAHYSDEVFAATSRLGLFRSPGPGAGWVAQDVPTMSGAIFDVAIAGDTVFVASSKGIAAFLLDGQILSLGYDKAAYRLCATPYGLAAATQEDGIILFPDYDSSWGTINQGLPEAHFATPDVCRIALTYNGGRLYTGNCGMPGLWSIKLESATSVERLPVPEVPRVTAVYPQPLSGTGSIVLEGRSDQVVRVALRDILGREVKLIFEGRLARSPITVAVRVDDIGSGTYLLEVSGSSGRSMHLVGILR